MNTLIARSLVQSVMAKEAFAQESSEQIIELAKIMITTFRSGGKLLIFGNGGSAADAQHMAAEFVNRYLLNRPPLPAIALNTDTSIITSIGNDFSFNQIFSKQVSALGKPGDLALGITTSGSSANVLKALKKAKELKLYTAALTGGTKKEHLELKALCDLVLNVPSDATPHIQETHIWVEHLLCEMVEKEMFGESSPS